VGVDTGGCNVQFAVSPATGRRVIIEMNPRVSRSSALASKATGFAIARVAAKLAVGYRLDELKNDITGTSACFEPALDYCVVKAPRFTFEKFEGAEPVLGPQMKAVGETMSLGGNFREALQKALRGLEMGLGGLEPLPRSDDIPTSRAEQLARLRNSLHRAGPERLPELYEALSLGLSLDEAHSLTGIDPWFLLQMQSLLDTERSIRAEFLPLLLREGGKPGPELTALWRHIKAQGFSDARIAALAREEWQDRDTSEEAVRAMRLAAGVRPVFRCVDTCAGEFTALTPYFYSTFDASHEDPAHSRTMQAGREGRRTIMILGGGPNRIGQGIEFDYCCVQAAFYLRDMGIRTIMVNSNPATVSTDFDTADRLYFEPLTTENILAVYEAERPDGVLVQFGGQTPINLAAALQRAGVSIAGTQPRNIALAEDREAFAALAAKLGIPQPASGIAANVEAACRIAKEIGYPVMIRASFVLGGRAMRIVHDEQAMREYVGRNEPGLRLRPDSPILVDKFLEDAVEVDVDAVADGRDVTIAAIMEHIEQAGIHSGDSCCAIPTHTLSGECLRAIREYTRALGLALSTVGLLNIQFAVQRERVYVLEANPRASRTVPFVSKTTGISVAGLAAQVMAGRTLAQIQCTAEPELLYHAVKEAVFPFERFPGATIELGPEMRSTGEVMGIDRSFGMAFLMAQAAAYTRIPYTGGLIVSVSDRDKNALVPLAARLAKLGFILYATPGTGQVLEKHGIQVREVVKIGPKRPHILDLLRNGDIHMVVNTVSGPYSARDATSIRYEAISRQITLLTTLTALAAAVEGLEARLTDRRTVAPLQDYYAGVVEGKVLRRAR
jgi:carbamoyl-phosphate synthase large subunit